MIARLATRRATKYGSADRGLFVLRVGLATLLVTLHGAPRVVRMTDYVVYGDPWAFAGFLSGLGLPLASLFALLSTCAESIAALLVGIGFLTRWAASIVAINMAAALIVETAGGDPVELPALYLLGAVAIAVGGAGAYALDDRRRFNRESRRIDGTRHGERIEREALHEGRGA